MTDHAGTIADDVRRACEASAVQLLPAGHWLVRKGQMLKTWCSGAVNGNPCPAYVRGSTITETTCPGLGVRHDGLPTLSDMRVCRQTATGGMPRPEAGQRATRTM